MLQSLCSRCSGLCCRYFALPIDNPSTARDYDDIRWYLCHENVTIFIEEGQWYIGISNRCKHLQADNRCGIYETRPTDCRTFFCEWMLEKGLGPEWKPERSKFALVMGEGGHLTAFVDPGFPSAWRNAPYFAAFKKLAADGARATPTRIITIRVGAKVIVVLPDREIDLGSVGPDESVRFEPGPNGRIEARKVARASASD